MAVDRLYAMTSPPAQLACRARAPLTEWHVVSRQRHLDALVRNSDRPSARLDIAHVLFMDLVGYSRVPLEEQLRRVTDLQAIVRQTEVFRLAQEEGTVLSHPAGDGMALAFFRDPSFPPQCALEVAERVRDRDDLPLRMGVHSGPVHRAEDINRTENVVGPGINIAQRVMDCGDAGHILMSYTTAEVLEQLETWETRLHDIGDVEVKHGLRLRLYTLVDGDLGLATVPSKVVDSTNDSNVETQRHNLPVALSSFIGRERHIQEAIQRLTHTRLLTLTGTGGAGKTRLSLRVGELVADDYEHGVWLVELAPMTDATLIPATLAAILGVGAESDRPLLAAVIQYLATRRALIILDNCEHLVAGVAGFAQVLLQACANVRILATSRELLGIPGEVAWPVPTLSLPEDGVSAESASGSEAIRLFVERAREARPDFAMTDENVSVVTAICRRLDGIPLAIELAAARARVMSLDQIRDRLDNRFRLLTGGGRASPPRQQTLRALIDWSYHLLDEPQQAVFARLALFGGGFTLEAAEDICAFGDIDAWDITDLVLQLVDRSLVVTDHAPAGPRYHMLESLREYGAERVAGSGDADETRRRHARFYARYVADAVSSDRADDEPTAVQRVEAEHPNIRQALAWALSDDPNVGLALVRDLEAPWRARGHLVEGQSWRQRYLDIAQALEPTVVATVRSHSAVDHYLQREFDLAIRDGERALAEFEALGAEAGAARVAMTLGQAANLMGDAGTADRHFDRVKALCSQDPDSWLPRAVATHQAFSMADRGEYSDAWELTERAARMPSNQPAGADLILTMVKGVIRRLQGEHDESGRYLDDVQAQADAAGDLGFQRVILWYQGELSFAQRDYASAYAYYGERLALERRLGGRSPAASCLARQGLMAMRLARFEAARGHYAEAAQAFGELNDTEGILRANMGLAAVDIAAGDPSQGARLLARWHETAGDISESVATAEFVNLCGWLFAQLGRPAIGARLTAAAAAWKNPKPSGHAFGDAAFLAPEDLPLTLRGDIGDVAYANAAADGATTTLTDALSLAAAELRGWLSAQVR